VFKNSYWIPGALILCFASTGTAQIPESNLYVFQLTMDDTARWHIHSPQFVSSWNPNGYTNQPEWIDDSNLLVSARRTGTDQNDIYHLNLATHLLKRCTDTPEHEFSPLLTPDKRTFSVVRQVSATPIDQQVYRFPLDLSGAGRPVFPGILNVGYHCWLTQDALALFLVDDPPKLAFIGTADTSPRIYSSLIGRCLKRTGTGELAYVHKYSDTFWYLKNLDIETKRSEILIETLPGQEDFAISPSGLYFMGSGTTLYVFDPERKHVRWVPVFDLSLFGLQHITRLAISADHKIAIVDQRN
jgi:hypothetical protein